MLSYFGGSGVIATELGIALAKQGHEVHFITYSRPKRLSALLPNVYYHEVSFQTMPCFSILRMKRPLQAVWLMLRSITI